MLWLSALTTILRTTLFCTSECNTLDIFNLIPVSFYDLPVECPSPNGWGLINVTVETVVVVRVASITPTSSLVPSVIVSTWSLPLSTINSQSPRPTAGLNATTVTKNPVASATLSSWSTGSESRPVLPANTTPPTGVAPERRNYFGRGIDAAAARKAARLARPRRRFSRDVVMFYRRTRDRLEPYEESLRMKWQEVVEASEPAYQSFQRNVVEPYRSFVRIVLHNETKLWQAITWFAYSKVFLGNVLPLFGCHQFCLWLVFGFNVDFGAKRRIGKKKAGGQKRYLPMEYHFFTWAFHLFLAFCIFTWAVLLAVVAIVTPKLTFVLGHVGWLLGYVLEPVASALIKGADHIITTRQDLEKEFKSNEKLRKRIKVGARILAMLHAVAALVVLPVWANVLYMEEYNALHY